ncbi:hypothetical protein [Sinomonas sp. P47F7]|uniref:hypothetical protein n=1 Tax=Sinomonas sp. P47F7 TaxID=3410987 RepID=UPI003BF4906C
MTHLALPTPTRFLRRGPWAAAVRGDELADVTYDGRPVLRGLRAVVRNHNWLTLTPEADPAVVREDDDALECRVDVAWAGFGGEYRGTVTVRMDDGGVDVAFEGTAPRDFLSNRIGLVALHRPDDAGRAVAVGHPDGTETHAAFPQEISPHQPFGDIAALGWERDGVQFSLGFTGDVFETEDQRNWTDASFKTYSTPLSVPFPVLHRAGSRVSQSVRLAAAVPVRVGTGSGVRVPEIVSWFGKQPVTAAPDLARGTVLLEVSAAPAPGDGTVSVGDALPVLAAASGADVRLVAGSARQAVAILEQLPLDRVCRLGVFDPATHVTAAETHSAVATRARELGFGGEIVSGARSHFTELNRNAHSLPGCSPSAPDAAGPDAAAPDPAGIAYSITSQMHAVEPEAVMESIPLQAATARQALVIGGGRPLHIGPITIAPRFNAVATEPPRADELPARSPLESQPFGAAWLVGSVAALTLPGVASLAYAVPEHPEAEQPEAPAAALLRRLAALRGAEVLDASSPAGGPAVCAIREASGITCFLANLRPWAVTAEVSGPAALGPGPARKVTVPAWSAAAVVLP